jgi:tetratricopeptide (TPR) repeat protein
MDTILLYAALTLVVVWTVRMARSKGKSPWLWGGFAVLLTVIPNLNLLAVIPMIFLMIIKSPQQQSRSITESTSCPRCRTSLVRKSRYCTSCGWDLAELYDPEAAPEDEESAATHAVEDREPVGISDPVGQSRVGESPSATAKESLAEAVSEADHEPSTEVTPPPYTSRKQPVSLVLPTAAGMTERGVGLFNQVRIQESIDQFTKAIALDPNYVEAWARRAEAYAQLGRGSEAAEDRRRLEALNTGLSGG